MTAEFLKALLTLNQCNVTIEQHPLSGFRVILSDGKDELTNYVGNDLDFTIKQCVKELPEARQRLAIHKIVECDNRIRQLNRTLATERKLKKELQEKLVKATPILPIRS